MKRGWVSFVVLVLPVLVLLPVPYAAAAITAASADDICAATDNPCIIDQVVEVISGSVLDFDTRDLEIIGSGELDIGSGSVAVLCGSFTVNVGSGTGLKVKGNVSGTTVGGNLAVQARSVCSGNNSLACLDSTVCAVAGAGTCGLGGGQITLNGKVAGGGDPPASLEFRAAGDVTVDQLINATGTLSESDGGSVELNSALGSIFLNKSIKASGGGLSGGGDVTMFAAQDIVIADFIDVNGGDFDGGFIDLLASGDIAINDELLANATSGEGVGGEIDIDAGGDITILGGTASNRLRIGSNGNFSVIENSGGDGGDQAYVAGGSITVGEFVRLETNGAQPDGFGETISMTAGVDVTISGEMEAKGRGTFSGGGLIELDAGRSLNITPTATLDLSGPDEGGLVTILAGTEVIVDGTVDLSSGAFGSAGEADIVVDGDIRLSGTLFNDGAGFGAIDLNGCRVFLESGGSIDNRADFASNVLVARERLTVEAGGELLASGGGGTNEIVYRDPAKPPVLSGTVSPAPTLTVDALLAGCPICGNAEVDQGETCDDGNQDPGDGCSEDCQDEGCVADTPGFPAVELCDDGGSCSVDVCNTTTHACEHIVDCEDGIACTVGGCVGAACVNVPDDSLCDDGNSCTLDTCVEGLGCMNSAISAAACDDGLFCNGADTCDNGQCSLHSGDPCPGGTLCEGNCNEVADNCFAPAGTACLSDGDLCTDDECDGLGNCAHPFNIDPCDDGVFCNGPDNCIAGSCSFHAGNPCVGGPVCANICNETGGNCFASSGFACIDDANPCTDDVCDGAGFCVHSNNFASCDDGDFCTAVDQCTDAECIGVDGLFWADGRFRAIKKAGVDNDRLKLRSNIALAELTAVPTSTGLQLVLFDSNGGQVYAAAIPAANFEDVRGKGTTFRFKDKDGLVASANGIQKVLLKKIDRKGLARLKGTMKGTEIPNVGTDSRASASVLFGSDPAVEECFTGSSMFCTGIGTKRTCRTP